jgi:hypothetical protein
MALAGLIVEQEMYQYLSRISCNSSKRNSAGQATEVLGAAGKGRMVTSSVVTFESPLKFVPSMFADFNPHIYYLQSQKL